MQGKLGRHPWLAAALVGTIAVGISVASLIATANWGARRAVRSAVAAAKPARRLPRISPDYADIVVPPNMAPLNFVIREHGQQFVVRLHSEAGEAIEVVSRSPAIRIPPSPWRRLLAASRGRQLQWDIYAQADGRWLRYQTIVNRVAAEEIDGYLVYRQIPPVYNRWREVSIRQRNLTNGNESLLLAGTALDVACVNCHSFVGNDPHGMLLGLRSNRFGRATLLATDGKVVKLDTALGYTAWHPSGRLAAYSTNQVRQFFHGARDEVREVLDLESALAYYRLDSQDSKRVPGASNSQQLATYPAWSPDGRWLYYCRAPRLWNDAESVPPARYAEVQYALLRISYDLDTDRWGEPEAVLATHQAGGSILLPRISPDGRFLLFCVCSHGCFPALEPTSDLYLLDLATGTHVKPPINSEFSESWHSWSSNSRWIAFSSKRQGGTFTRSYLSYVDESGQAHKPFVIPQDDPEFYDSFLETCSVPELLTGPVPVTPAALARAARGEAIRVADAEGEVSRVETSDPYPQADR